MSTDLIDLLTRMGHDVNKPIVVEYTDGTSTTLPSLADVVAEQQALLDTYYRQDKDTQ